MLPAGQPLREQRFDVTKFSAIKLISVIEFDPALHRDGPFAELVHAVSITPERPPVGWLEGGSYTSITREGKLALLAGWADAEAAHASQEMTIAPPTCPALRSRLVREGRPSRGAAVLPRGC